MKKLRVVYDAEFGDAMPEAKVADYVLLRCLEFQNSLEGTAIVVGLSQIVDEFRLQAKRGNIVKPDDIIFVFKGEELKMNADARLPRWPKGFCDFVSNQLRALM